MASSDSDSQSPIFWERLRRVFTSPAEPDRLDEEDSSRNGSVIALCILIAVVLWLSFTLQEVRVVTMQLPTNVVNVPAEQALQTVPPSQVSVQVEGEGIQLLWMYYNRPVVPLDATARTVNLADMVDLPGDVRLQSIMPRQVSVELGPQVTGRVPLQSRVHVQTPPAYELLHPPRLRPDSVMVTGARSVVSTLSAWPTDSVRIENVRDSMAVSVPLADTLQQLVHLSIQRTTVILEAGRFAEATREIDVEVTGVPSDQNLVALEPSTIQVNYRVLFEQLFESKRTPAFFATVSYNQIRSDTTGYVRPELQWPSNLMIRDPEMTPERLQYYTFVAGN